MVVMKGTRYVTALRFSSSVHQIRLMRREIQDSFAGRRAGIQGERIKEDAEYEGVRVRVPASLDGARISMQIDIGFGDLGASSA